MHRRVWALAGPMILSNLSIPLVHLVDSSVAGHLPNAHQLGAVVVGSSFYTFLIGTLGFLRMGTTGLTAQACGRLDGGQLRMILVQALIMAFFLTIIMGLSARYLAGIALGWSEPSPELSAAFQDFFQFRLLGLPAALCNIALVGWFLGTQNARAPLVILLTTNSINILLVFWFVHGLDWGVTGVAKASVTAEWCGCVTGLWLTRKTLSRYAGQIKWQTLLNSDRWWPLLTVNRDIFIRSLALQGVFILITLQGTRLGDATVAANTLLLNGLILTAYALDGLAHAVEAICGHAIGAKDRMPLYASLIVTTGWSLMASLLFALGFYVFGQWFINVQSDIDSVRQIAYRFLPYLTCLPLLAMWSYLLDGLFIGATRAREMRNAMLIALALCLPLGWLSQDFGNHGLWLSFLAFMTVRGIVLAAYAWRLNQSSGGFVDQEGF